MVVRRAPNASRPFDRNPALLFEPQQRRTNRVLVERERALSELIHRPGDRVSVRPLEERSSYTCATMSECGTTDALLALGAALAGAVHAYAQSKLKAGRREAAVIVSRDDPRSVAKRCSPTDQSLLDGE